MHGELISPCGDVLISTILPPPAAEELRAYALQLPSIRLSERSLCDLELISTGAFSPLDRFMGARDYLNVLSNMRLGSGHLFPIPITLPVDSGEAIHLDREVALCDRKNTILAVMNVEEIYEWDLIEECRSVLGTVDPRHALVSEMQRWGKLYVSGKLRVLQSPQHYDFKEIRLTPSQTREQLERMGYRDVVAFQTRNPLHRAHEELTKRAMDEVRGALLLHPVVGMTKPGDVGHYTRVRTYTALAGKYYQPGRVLLSLLPLAMRLAGPREALWHAVIRRNFGANHLIVGRDHASPGIDSAGRPFYGPYDAQEMVKHYVGELGVRVLPYRELLYIPAEDRYEESEKIAPGRETLTLSGTAVREDYLRIGRPLPEWFTRREVADILTDAYPPSHRRGFCIWFTGLSGAGKSTTAEVLTVFLLEQGRQVTVLDGDVVRTHLSRGLGFSKEDRDINIRRIGYVASEVVRHRGIAVCAAVSPYRATRNDVRNSIGNDSFVEVFVDTPLEICELRDTKGMYVRARRGEIKDFTGIGDPYEPPQNPEVLIETVSATPEDNARTILDYLFKRKLLLTEVRMAAEDEELVKSTQAFDD